MPAALVGSVSDSLHEEFDALTASELIAWAEDQFGEGLVMSTSFGIQSAVLLHLATRLCPSIPVIWVDTGYLPQETHDYAKTLIDRLDLNVHVARAELSPAEMESRYGRLWESDKVEDLNLYDQIRKVEPMQRALVDLKATAWLAGLRGEQTEYRRRLPRVKWLGSSYRIYPILPWSTAAVERYMRWHKLPPHPLAAKGYTTVGDAHSSRPRCADDADDRATRFRGLKQECGLHLR